MPLMTVSTTVSSIVRMHMSPLLLLALVRILIIVVKCRNKYQTSLLCQEVSTLVLMWGVSLIPQICLDNTSSIQNLYSSRAVLSLAWLSSRNLWWILLGTSRMCHESGQQWPHPDANKGASLSCPDTMIGLAGCLREPLSVLRHSFLDKYELPFL
jgi:hypothetical protein